LDRRQLIKRYMNAVGRVSSGRTVSVEISGDDYVVNGRCHDEAEFIAMTKRVEEAAGTTTSGKIEEMLKGGGVKAKQIQDLRLTSPQVNRIAPALTTAAMLTVLEKHALPEVLLMALRIRWQNIAAFSLNVFRGLKAVLSCPTCDGHGVVIGIDGDPRICGCITSLLNEIQDIGDYIEEMEEILTLKENEV
jgi:hypothetical protein